MSIAANIIFCHRCEKLDLSSSGDLPCDVDGFAFVVHAEQDHCPIGNFGSPAWPEGFTPPPIGVTIKRKPVPPPADHTAWGPPLWQRIHAAQPPAENREAWLAELLKPIPCGECRQHANDYLAAHPVDWDNWFSWAVDLHNAVNHRLGKPIIDLPEAIKRWPAATAVRPGFNAPSKAR